jgi:arginine decarboxylase
LGVDYDGSRSAFDSSTNYTLQEYTNDIVFYIGEVCNQEQVPHPQIVSESGRAIVAHHSVLLVETLGTIEKIRAGAAIPTARTNTRWCATCWTSAKTSQINKLEAFHDATDRREEAQKHVSRSACWICATRPNRNALLGNRTRGRAKFSRPAYVPEEIRKLEDSLGDQVLCNFSVFQSLLDHWALGQLFPIMPVSRLNEKPTREGTLVDITCDSDGEVKKFIDLTDVRDTLPMHAPRPNGNGPEPYYLGFFLMGAYQDIMGDLHNLFGRVNELHVFLDPDEAAGYYVEEIIEGSTIVQALTSVQYDENELKRQMKMQIDEAIKSDRLKPSEGMRLLDDYERGLKEYTYLAI